MFRQIKIECVEPMIAVEELNNLGIKAYGDEEFGTVEIVFSGATVSSLTDWLTDNGYELEVYPELSEV